jgi:hypothetical protein
MAKWALFAVVLLAKSVGCQSGDAGEDSERDAGEREVMNAESERDAGSTTSSEPGLGGPIGAAPSCDAMQCAREAEEQARALMTPATWSRELSGGSCEHVEILGVAEGMACICSTGGSGALFIGPEGAGCYAYGRAGDFLLSDQDYEPCDPEQDTCAAQCQAFEARFAADARASFDVEVRFSSCADDGFCRSVLRIEDRCYADHAYAVGRAYACSLSDKEILARDKEAQKADPVPSCSDSNQDGGVCSEDSPAPSEDDCVTRPDAEWQGLRVCPPYPPCEESAYCGLALACISGECRACTSDEQCAPGEGCVLDHCLLQEQIMCRGRNDCKTGELCALSGYTGGSARSNEDMRSYCLSLDGGTPRGR